MSEEARFEIPKEMRSMAEASFEQARQTFEKFLSSAHQAAGSFEERGATARTNAKEIGSKAVAYAEKNVQASLDYAQSLLKSKDASEVMKLHSEYANARPGGAGQRNGPDRQPRRDGCGQAQELTRAADKSRQEASGTGLQPSGRTLVIAHPARVVVMAASEVACDAQY